MADPKIKVVVEVDDKKALADLKNLQQVAVAVGKAMVQAAQAAGAGQAQAAQQAGAAQAQAGRQAGQIQVALAKAAAGQAAQIQVAQARAAANQAAQIQIAQAKAAGQVQVVQAKQVAQAQQQAARQVVVAAAQQTTAFQTLLGTMQNIVFTAGILGATFKKALDFAEEGARITQTGRSFENFATNIAGIPDLLERLRAASRGTITDFDLMRSVLTLVAGTSAETGAKLAEASPQLLEIARAAQVLNPALGSVDYFMSSLATGIKRISPFLLDNLGIVVRARDAYARYARELGISAQTLTAEQKSQAFLNETLRVGQLLIEQNAGAVDSAVDPYSRLRVEIEEAGHALKQFLAEGLLPYVQILNGDYSQAAAKTVEDNLAVATSMADLTAQAERLSEVYQAVGPRSLLGKEGLEQGILATATAMAEQAGSLAEFESALESFGSEEQQFFDRTIGFAGLTTESFYNMTQQFSGTAETVSKGVKPAFDALTGSMLALQYALIPTTELTEEQAEALEKMREAQADAAKSAIENAANLTEFQKQMLASADAANLTVGELFRFAEGLGIVSQAELEAARFAYEFQAANAKMLAGVAAGTMTMTTYVARVRALLATEEDRLRGQRVAEAVQQRANLALAQYGSSLVGAANQALKLKRANDAATQSVQKLATVSAGAASAFINALEGGTAGGGGSGVSAIEAAAQAQQEWNQAFGKSFMELLKAEKPLENYNLLLLEQAANAGVGAETLALLAAATGEYSQEQIATALKGAAMKQAIEEITAALVDGRATADQALAAVSGFQQQLDQGGSFKFDLQAYGIEPLREMAEGAAGGAGAAADETQNWTDNLLKLADQGHLTAGDLVLLAEATGKYSDAQIQAALKTLFMTQKLEELSKQIGKRPMKDIIEDLREFESDLDKQFQLQFNTGDAEEAIGRVRRGLDEMPTDVTVKIHVEADEIPNYAGVAGQTGPGVPGSGGGGKQHGGPLAGITPVGEVRKEWVIGGQVIPRIPPGFFVAQEGFAQTMALALAGSMAALPSYSNTTNINRTVNNNNQRTQQVIINATPSGAGHVVKRELGAF